MRNKLPPVVGYPEVEWAELAYQLAKEAGDLYLAKEIAMKLANFHADTWKIRIDILESQIKDEESKNKEEE